MCVYIYVFNYVFTMNTDIAKYFPNFCCHQEWKTSRCQGWKLINFYYPGKKKKKKKNEILPFATTWMDQENITLSEISHRKPQIQETNSLPVGRQKERVAKQEYGTKKHRPPCIK